MAVDLEFFIQKEGDDEWLPLESLSVEILVGRYQLMAQTSEADCPIQIQIAHRFFEDDVLQETLQQQLLQTNSLGQIEILPSTFLQQGSWQISCASQQQPQQDQADQHCVQLQVLASDIDLDETWDFVDAPPLHSPPSQADQLQPLVAADISAEAAWEKVTPVHTPLLVHPLFISSQVETTAATHTEVINTETTHTEATHTKATNDVTSTPTPVAKILSESAASSPATSSPSEPSLPELPEIPKDVPPVRLEISPGIILPPALYTPKQEDLPQPELPRFPHLDNWAQLSYKELSIALGRMYWSKLDAYGETIDLDFQALDLQRRFLQNLHQLFFEGPSSSPNNWNPSIPKTQPVQAVRQPCTALLPITFNRES